MAVEITTGLRDNTIGLIEQFAEIATVDPLVAAMLLTGAILTIFAAGVFGVLTLGAVLSVVRRALPSAPELPQQAR